MKAHTQALLWSAIALVTSAGRVPAQRAPVEAASSQAVAPYRVTGTVVNPQGSPVFGVDVSVIERDTPVRRVRSDSSGKFLIDALTASTVKLRVRRIGFRQQDLWVNVPKSARTAPVFVTLEPAIANLDTVVVDDSAPPEPVNPRLIAFRDRAVNNSFGHFITEEMLARLRPHLPSDALRNVPGVNIRPAPMRRIGNTVRLRGCGLRGAGESSDKVGPLIWLDGVRLVCAEIDEVTVGDDIAAIEVYNSLVGVPAQYLDRSAVCGTILIWTKSR